MTAPERHVDLAVIGSGMAGMAAALFAANRGISTALVGNTGGMRFFSGLVDLMAVYPLSMGKSWKNPWEAIQVLAADKEQSHPYSRIKPEAMKLAMNEFFAVLHDGGLPYHTGENGNQDLLTSVGTVKRTFGVPHTMREGVRAYQDRAPCLIIGFPELKGFSSRQVRETAESIWPALRSMDVPFPGGFRELFPEQAAKEMENEGCREALVQSILPHRKEAGFVGFPAVLGMDSSLDVHLDLEKRLGVPVFEIPSLPPSIPGLRLLNLFQRQVAKRGVETFLQEQVSRISPLAADGFLLHVGSGADQIRIHAKGAVLATGRFFGKGLAAERDGIRETLFNLPVTRTGSRSGWHDPDFFAVSGHGINMAGLEIDDAFHPLDREGKPAFSSLFAAGSILAHQDWIRMKCGAGLAVTTAYAAVASCAKEVLGHAV